MQIEDAHTHIHATNHAKQESRMPPKGGKRKKAAAAGGAS